MSAFVVDDAVVNRIAAFVHYCSGYRQAPWMYVKADAAALLSMTHNAADPEHDDKYLAMALFATNCDAVGVRYGEARLPEFRINSLTFKAITPAANNPVAVVKDMDCLLYQCSEGDIPERPLYKAMAKFRDHVCRVLIAEMPEYDAAPWGSEFDHEAPTVS